MNTPTKAAIILLLLVPFSVSAQSKRQIQVIEEGVRFQTDLNSFGVTFETMSRSLPKEPRQIVRYQIDTTRYAISSFLITVRTAQTVEEMGATAFQLKRLITSFKELCYQYDLANDPGFFNPELQAYLRALDLDLHRLVTSYSGGSKGRQAKLKVGEKVSGDADVIGEFSRQPLRKAKRD